MPTTNPEDGDGVVPLATPCPHCGSTTLVPYHWPMFPNHLNSPARIRLPEDTGLFLRNAWRCWDCVAVAWPHERLRWTALHRWHQVGMHIEWEEGQGPAHGWWRREEATLP